MNGLRANTRKTLMPRELIILDRDGVINKDSSNYIKSAEEWHPIKGSLEAIAALNQAGFVVAVATNQSGIGRKLYNESALEAMHQKFRQLLDPLSGHVSFIAHCPHVPDDNCDCRKPKVGMVREIEKQVGLSAAGRFFVGDRLSDIQTAQAANMIPILVKTGKGIETLLKHAEQLEQVEVFDNLSLAAQFIIAQKR